MSQHGSPPSISDPPAIPPIKRKSTSRVTVQLPESPRMNFYPPKNEQQSAEPADVEHGSIAPISRMGTFASVVSRISRISRVSRAATISLSQTLSANLHPRRPPGPAPGVMDSIRVLVFCSWINLLLVCIPVSWALHFVWQHNATSTQDTIVFVLTFLAIMPLANLLSFTTDELSKRVGETLAGLLNATLGNAVELIVGVIALFQCQLQIVTSSLVGSILSNILLVLGTCFFVGGIRFSEQGFSLAPAQLNASLLVVAVAAILIPAAFYFAVGSLGQGNNVLSSDKEGHIILSVSRGSAIVLLFLYLLYLIFQLKTHKDLYEDNNPDTFKSRKFTKKEPSGNPSDSVGRYSYKKLEAALHLNRSSAPAPDSLPTTNADTQVASSSEGSHQASHPETNTIVEEEEEEGPEPVLMSWQVAVGALLVVTVLVAVTAEFLVDSINGLTDTGKINKQFVGLILLPIVGNAAEHVTAVSSSYKDKVNLAMSVAVGSSLQIAYFVLPLLVIIAWIAGKPLTLLFDPFQSIVLLLTVLALGYTTADGKCNWYEGVILVSLYFLIAIPVWFYPGVDISSTLASC